MAEDKPISIDSFKQVLAQRKQEAQDRAARRENGYVQLDQFAVNVLGACRALKDDGEEYVKVGIIGGMLLEAGCERETNEVFPVIAKFLEKTCGFKVAGRSSGIRFFMPIELPTVEGTVMTRQASYERPKPSEAT